MSKAETIRKTEKHAFTASLANEVGGEAVLVLSGYIWQDNNNASAKIAAALAELPDGVKLTVLLRNLYGGDTDEGLTIYHDLLDHKPKIKVDGVVASYGSVIMLAGEDVEISAHSKIMTHRPWGDFQGDFEDMRSRADQNEGAYLELAGIYAKRMNVTVGEAAALLMPKGKDVWLTPKKAVELGLCTTITNGSLLRATVAIKDLKNETDPDAILNRFQAALNEDEVVIDEPQKNKMNKELLKKLGLAESATQDEVDAAMAKAIEGRDQAVLKLGELEAAESTRLESDFATLVDDAVKANALTIPQKDELVKQSKGNVAVALGMARTMIASLKPHVPASAQLGGKDSASAKKMADRAEWNYNDWAMKDTKGLAEMRDTDKAAFEKLKAERPRAHR